MKSKAKQNIFVDYSFDSINRRLSRKYNKRNGHNSYTTSIQVRVLMKFSKNDDAGLLFFIAVNYLVT